MTARIARTLEQASGFGPSAVAIGVFDGVHLGHQELLRRTVAAARERGLKPAVLTFDPHPACVVAPARAPKLLLSVEERCERIAAAGIDEILILPFDDRIAAMPPEEFASGPLRSALQARVILVGDNFRFGCARAGTIATLTELGFETLPLTRIQFRGIDVSSSEIRKRVEAGDVSRACRLLNRPYATSGDIVHGHGIGSKQTVPTLNLATGAEVLPATGVYITRTTDLADGRQWKSITNVGRRPTFEEAGGLSIESFLLDPFTEPTPQRIRLEYLRRVREERKFSSPEALKTQILKDVSAAKAYFRRLSPPRPSAD
ncbi:MAG: bifunctional riboflavin kinase/FAD synthetase [Acidobacteriota bacterium]